jgi:hypothetical protein
MSGVGSEELVLGGCPREHATLARFYPEAVPAKNGHGRDGPATAGGTPNLLPHTSHQVVSVVPWPFLLYYLLALLMTHFEMPRRSVR